MADVGHRLHHRIPGKHVILSIYMGTNEATNIMIRFLFQSVWPPHLKALRLWDGHAWGFQCPAKILGLSTAPVSPQ